MNYIKITKRDVANGSGVRCTLWVSGCTCHCKGCQNPSTWDFNSGVIFTSDTTKELLLDLQPSYIQGLTLSGGHPLEKPNENEILRIVSTVRHFLPNKTIWLYTGYALEPNDFFTDNDSVRSQILRQCDVVVDGAYVEALRDITLKFRGSSNQRLIDVQKTIKARRIITLEDQK